MEKSIQVSKIKAKLPELAYELGGQERAQYIKNELSEYGVEELIDNVLGDDATEAQVIITAKSTYTKRTYTTRHFLCYSCHKEMALRMDDHHYGQPVIFCNHKCLMTYLKIIKWKDLSKLEHSNIKLQSKEIL